MPKESEGVGSPIASPTLNLLLIGDVVGSPGREAIKRCVSLLREQHQIHACIANGENAAGGFGLTAQTADEMFESGVDFITGGNHIFDKRDFAEYLETSGRVIRPANYPPAVPGRGAATFSANGVTIAVLNLMGRTFMPPVDDPFRCADALVSDLRARTPVIIVDVHAEATSEKVALGRYLDGRVSCIFGTHTHVQTADERILPGGTAYISDLGMTGPTDGVIGMEQGPVLDRFLTGFSERFSVQKSGSKQLCGAVVAIDPSSGKASEIKRVFLKGIA
ncbi:MAG: TIGR00282 family metallophosphoesterase [Candidatus Baltobacteraceae bacterium]